MEVRGPRVEVVSSSLSGLEGWAAAPGGCGGLGIVARVGLLCCGCWWWWQW